MNLTKFITKFMKIYFYYTIYCICSFVGLGKSSLSEKSSSCIGCGVKNLSPFQLASSEKDSGCPNSLVINIPSQIMERNLFGNIHHEVPRRIAHACLATRLM